MEVWEKVILGAFNLGVACYLSWQQRRTYRAVNGGGLLGAFQTHEQKDEERHTDNLGKFDEINERLGSLESLLTGKKK